MAKKNEKFAFSVLDDEQAKNAENEELFFGKLW